MIRNASLKIMADLEADYVPLLAWNMRPSFCKSVPQVFFRRIFMWAFEGRFQNKLDKFQNF